MDMATNGMGRYRELAGHWLLNHFCLVSESIISLAYFDHCCVHPCRLAIDALWLGASHLNKLGMLRGDLSDKFVGKSCLNGVGPDDWK